MPELNIDSTYGVVIIKDFKAVHADDNYARIFGYESAEELLSSISSFLDLIDPEYHDSVRKNFYRMLSGEITPKGKTFTNYDRNGRKFSVFTVDHVIEWEGEPAIQVTVIDLSMVEEANRRIRENDLKYKRLITTSGQGILVHRNFKPLMVNQAWVDLMHAPSIDYVINNVNVFDFIPDDARELALTRYDDIIRGKVEGFHHITENTCFDGKQRYFNVYDNLIDWDGEPAIQAVIEDVTEKVKLEQELEYKATHDQLTDLLNREAIFKWLNDSQSTKGALACLLIDIDDFKSVNDSYGHFSGDMIIQSIAGQCRDFVGENGVVGRWGGEEFIVFIPGITKEEAIEKAEALRKKCKLRSYEVDGHKIRRTISVGVAHQNKPNEDIIKRIPTSDKTRINKLIRKADQKLYEAKAKGRNRVEC
ncbi:diguanylate cyclase [Vibrio sp. JC009]|uniref:sensor domain-containing diguanylate cyclase n=1 Tax=Vibrio sp. JC009 TaxID=2912314 RepID=UPI0023B1D2EA|nr:diguanylate cyclase [Vibrio sp. JC009]WED23543.1 diguanylate cyclase [Vibrio sp. JC009]